MRSWRRWVLRHCRGCGDRHRPVSHELDEHDRKVPPRTWAAADPASGVAQHPASYATTFVDMARAAVAENDPGRGMTLGQLRRAWPRSAGRVTDATLVQFARTLGLHVTGGDAALENLEAFVQRNGR